VLIELAKVHAATAAAARLDRQERRQAARMFFQ